MRASCTSTCNSPGLTGPSSRAATAIKEGTGITDIPSAKAMPWATAHATRKPVKPPGPCPNAIAESRSEEHTSELQSLMRNSYAVFCLKKKKKKSPHKTTTHEAEYTR